MHSVYLLSSERREQGEGVLDLRKHVWDWLVKWEILVNVNELNEEDSSLLNVDNQ